MSLASRLFGAISLLGLATMLTACPKGQCWVRLKQVDASGKETNSCLVDSCPKNSSFTEGTGCGCNAGFVTLGGACVTEAEANQHCGTGNRYANGGCVAITCPAGQILNAQTGGCESRAAVDQAVAASAGVTLKEGQSVGCPSGYTYVVNGKEGACVPNESTCGAGTKYENGACVAVACAAGTVFDAATGQCVKLATTSDDKTFSVQAKLKAALGPDFCAPHAKNPASFNVQPGQSLTIKIAVTVNVPGNDIEKTVATSVRTTNVGGAELTPQMFPGVTKINKQVDDQVIKSIRALGGKSVEANASSEVTCVIKRAPIAVVETHGGGV